MTLHVKVKPGSKVDQLFYDSTGQLNVKIKAPAQDGKANAYLVEFLAKQFKIAKSNVTIIAGLTNPHKRINVDGDEKSIQATLDQISPLSKVN
ncbi:DUF167 domain-containing protein [Spirosoma validum]|uniref:UPF0235 protein IC230_02760 n=1 Tax=Spirosoma validum TaxID=2771355 RepID=A0A927AY28_9BACT|nr:DUF167 domain-containing protein [Spirosoma validum]MBD2751797.1 DUF167 domain-containing protein [Spirosoma validum]